MVLGPLCRKLNIRMHVLRNLIHKCFANFDSILVAHIKELSKHISRLCKALNRLLELVALRKKFAELEHLKALQRVTVWLVNLVINLNDLSLVLTGLSEVSHIDREEHCPFKNFLLQLV